MTLHTPDARGLAIGRRTLLGSAAVAWGTLAMPAFAQSPCPNRPVKFIVPFPAGGPVDTTGRVKLALTADGGGSDSLARALPPQTALQMLLDGGVTAAGRRYDLGLVNRVVPHGEALSRPWHGCIGWPPVRSMRRPASRSWCTQRGAALAARNATPSAMHSSRACTETPAAKALHLS